MPVSSEPSPAALTGESGQLALSAYEAFAPFYDRFTEECKYEKWLTGLEAWALACGLAGTDVLDVACGTGKSFAPLLDRGYVVTACDLSPAMVKVAQRNYGERAEICVRDMRALSWCSRFDLVTCIDDAMNYLLSPEDLELAVAAMFRALRPGGILVFDTNSLATFRTAFADEFEVRSGPVHYRWRGEGNALTPSGATSSATLEASTPNGSASSRHVERHWPIAVLKRTCATAGFTDVRFRGQLTGCRLLGQPDELLHTKIVCLAKKPYA